MIHLYKDFYLTADTRQFVLFEVKIREKGKKAGEEKVTNQKYFPTLEPLFKSLFTQNVRRELETEDLEILIDFEKRYLKLLTVVKKVSQKIGNIRNLIEEMGEEDE